MAGENPYLKAQNRVRPKKAYKITFEGYAGTLEVRPEDLPLGQTGLPGSILDIALHHGIAIDHACGGVCACSTCHVHVTQGLEHCSAASEEELDMLDLAPDLKPNSRLSCQAVPNGEGDIVVRIPSWNRNLVREGNEG